MSKNKGNYIGLASEAKDVFGKLMSCPDRLLPPYLKALTELLDPEIDLLLRLMAERKIHPMGVKTLLASEVTGTIHGLEVAAACRAGFKAQFSQKRFSDTPNAPVVDRAEHADTGVGELFVKVTRTVPSMNQVRRVAAGGGLRLAAESAGADQRLVALVETDVNTSLKELLAAHETLVAQENPRIFLKCGRVLIQIR